MQKEITEIKDTDKNEKPRKFLKHLINYLKRHKFSGFNYTLIIALILAFFFPNIRNIILYLVLIIEIVTFRLHFNSYANSEAKIISMFYIIFTFYWKHSMPIWKSQTHLRSFI